MATTLESYNTFTIPLASKGIDKVSDPMTMDAAYSPNMQNIVITPGQISKMLGYRKIGTASLPLSGIGMEMISYIDARGLQHLLALTSTSAYQYAAETDTWAVVSPAAPFSGDADDVFRSTLVHDMNMFTNNGGTALLVCNGANDIHYYEGTSAGVFTILVHTFPAFTSTLELVEFWNHLCMANYTDTAQQARVITWADFADIDDWALGTSGDAYLTDSVGQILRAIKMGDTLCVMSERSITAGRYIGGSSVFQFPTVVEDFGLFSPQSAYVLFNSLIFFGSNRKIYAYFGERQFESIGDRIDTDFFSRVDQGKKRRMSSFYDSQAHTLYFFFPSTGDTYAKSFYALHSIGSDMLWEYGRFTDAVRGAAEWNNTVYYYCNGVYATLYCDEVVLYCDDASLTVGYPVIVFLSSDGYTYKLDGTGGQHDDSNIEAFYETPDISINYEEMAARTQWFSFTAKTRLGVASTLTVSYSVDGGATWSDFTDSPITLTSSWTRYRLSVDVVSRRIRFRLYQNSAGDFTLRGNMHCKIKQESDRSD